MGDRARCAAWPEDCSMPAGLPCSRRGDGSEDADRGVLEVGDDVLDHPGEERRVDVLRDVAEVRCQQRAGRGPERVVGGQRLLVEDVETDTAQLPGVESGE